MSSTAAARRRRWLWPALLLALAASAFLGLRALLQPDRLSGFLLQQAEAASGLRITLERPAEIGLWPDLHLSLYGLEVSAPAVAAPMLRSQRVEVALPWSTLAGGELRLRELRLLPMHLDIDELQRWRASEADLGPPAPLRLPRLDAGLLTTRSRVQWGDWTLADFHLQLTGLQAGQPSTLTLAGILAGPQLRRTFRLVAGFIPHQRADAIVLDPLTLMASEQSKAEPWAQARGRIELAHPHRLSTDLEVLLPRWPADWPPLPFSAATDSPLRLQLGFAGSPQLQGRLNIELRRDEQQLVAELDLGDLAGWLATARTEPPPLRGLVRAPQLRWAEVELQGVSLRLDQPPTAAAGVTEGDRSGDR